MGRTPKDKIGRTAGPSAIPGLPNRRRATANLNSANSQKADLYSAAFLIDDESW
jgi:hypothetical protein